MKKLRPTSKTDSRESPARPSYRALERQQANAASTRSKPFLSRAELVARQKAFVERHRMASSQRSLSCASMPGSLYVGQPEVLVADHGLDLPLQVDACKAAGNQLLVMPVLAPWVKDADQRAASIDRKHRRKEK